MTGLILKSLLVNVLTSLIISSLSVYLNLKRRWICFCSFFNGGVAGCNRGKLHNGDVYIVVTDSLETTTYNPNLINI